MTAIDIDTLQDWVGTEETLTDCVRESAVRQFRYTLEDYLVDADQEIVPPGFHWTLFQPMVPSVDLGEDGHPRSLGLLPEMPMSSRMWAGGDVVFRSPLGIGDEVVRHTKVDRIEEKAGGSGTLIFVTLSHEIEVRGRPHISETQSLVYRNPGMPAGRGLPGREQGTGRPFRADSVMLFRYSALTFNSHRIHYDRSYAQDVENYPDLVVHGPLQATLLINDVAASLGHSRIGFSYRGALPLYVDETAYLCRTGGGAGEAWVERAPGDTTMKGKFIPVSKS